MTWEKRLAEQVSRKFKNYNIMRFDLAEARDRQPLDVVGDYVGVNDVSTDNAVCYLALNSITNDLLKVKDGVDIETVFTSVFLTNTAQVGQWIELIFATDFKKKRQ